MGSEIVLEMMQSPDMRQSTNVNKIYADEATWSRDNKNGKDMDTVNVGMSWYFMVFDPLAHDCFWGLARDMGS